MIVDFKGLEELSTGVGAMGGFRQLILANSLYRHLRAKMTAEGGSSQASVQDDKGGRSCNFVQDDYGGSAVIIYGSSRASGRRS